MEIRTYRESDAFEIAALVHGAVHAIATEAYTPQQKEAWAPTPPDYSAWRVRLATKQPFVAVHQGTIVGFIELEEDGHIDCLYVHKDYQGLGFGSRLLKHLIQVANRRGIDSLYVEASKVSKPLFGKFGFVHTRTNKVLLRGEVLVNYTMTLAVKP